MQKIKELRLMSAKQNKKKLDNLRGKGAAKF